MAVDWVGRVKQNLTFTIELDSVGGFVYFGICCDCGLILDFLCFDSSIFFMHILYMIHTESGSPFPEQKPCTLQQIS